MVHAAGPTRVKLYAELASWWPLLSPVQEYAEYAQQYAATLRGHTRGELRTVLELGAGGGHNAYHLKKQFDLTLVDRSPAMIEQSTKLNPECEHLEGDMRILRLERTFDAVFIHDAISYLTSLEDLAATLRTAFVHCRAGGGLLLAPDHTRETFQECTDDGGGDDEQRSMRWLAWFRDPDPDDDTYVVDFAYMLRGKLGELEVVHDQHVHGLFSDAQWRDTITSAGFELPAQPGVLVAGGGHVLYAATRPLRP